ncbi:hypothetical protein [Oribacterium sp. P6A1]|uniref:hypothetical protein n=1 Tax=Oribacterium sp. P6A1 TaxID=1410612 RepID=UPI000B1545E4|nr:hypothetical protein [Oribacterium sp. P6A1]
MKRKIRVLAITLCALTLFCGCGMGTDLSVPAAETTAVTEDSTAVKEQGVTDKTSDSSFSYVHDPRKNPKAMADIVENPAAVYGFSPSPDSERLGTYAEYDWTDPKVVQDAKEKRTEYHKSLKSMDEILHKMTTEGASVEEMARAVSAEKNRIRLESYKDDPEGLKKLKQSNLDTYGHEDGPTPDEMFEKYGSWEVVMQKAFSTNMGMDACCGLYDEYYQQYIELGYVEE